MKFLCLSLVLFACIACEANSELPSNVQLGADAITARQTSDAASARSNALAAQATAVRQSTRDAADARSTDAAIQIAFLNVTRTAEARQTERADLDKTETARDNAAVQSRFATYTAQTPTARAIATMTRRADEDATATASLLQARTREARDAATATRHAQYPTETRVAVLAAQARTDQDHARQMQQRRNEGELFLAPLLGGVSVLLLPVTLICVTAIFVLGLWSIFRAVESYIRSHAVSLSANSSSKFLITDATGNPIGYFTPTTTGVQFNPIEYEMELPETETKPAAPILMMDRSENASWVRWSASQNSTNQNYGLATVAPPAEPLIGDFVYPSTLRAFTQVILAENDWTQARWRDKVLPRGFVMSMDTKDAAGNTVYGGYSRLLQLFEDRHLIINRRPGATGQWNPNAPRDIERVMDILEKKAPLPPIQAVEPPAPTPSPTPSRKRVKKTANQFSSGR